MIEQNYFKASRDNGPGSTNRSKKFNMMGSSSRDDGKPGKDRRRNRRLNQSKSELVVKNDIDDVTEGGFDSRETQEDNMRHTRDFIRKLRDAETVHKLQQIAEVDDEGSDDGYGPIERENPVYDIVPNRSSFLADPSSLGS
jgi:hypothetical protein